MPQNWWAVMIWTGDGKSSDFTDVWRWLIVSEATPEPEPVRFTVYRPFDQYPEKWEPRPQSRRDVLE
jgi:hypothetical protein